jgi:hypothetical protein
VKESRELYELLEGTYSKHERELRQARDIEASLSLEMNKLV